MSSLGPDRCLRWLTALAFLAVSPSVAWATEPAAASPTQAAAPESAPVADAASGARKASAHSQFGASGSPPPATATATGFDFGSYGRVGIGSDLRGHSGHAVNVVSFGSRLEKPAYLELNFYYGGMIGDDPEKRREMIQRSRGTAPSASMSWPRSGPSLAPPRRSRP